VRTNAEEEESLLSSTIGNTPEGGTLWPQTRIMGSFVSIRDKFFEKKIMTQTTQFKDNVFELNRLKYVLKASLKIECWKHKQSLVKVKAVFFPGKTFREKKGPRKSYGKVNIVLIDPVSLNCLSVSV